MKNNCAHLFHERKCIEKKPSGDRSAIFLDDI